MIMIMMIHVCALDKNINVLHALLLAVVNRMEYMYNDTTQPPPTTFPVLLGPLYIMDGY